LIPDGVDFDNIFATKAEKETLLQIRFNAFMAAKFGKLAPKYWPTLCKRCCLK